MRASLPVDFVCGRGALVVSVGRNQECVPACCITLRYKRHAPAILPSGKTR